MSLPDLRRFRRPWTWVPFSIRLRWARVRALLVRHKLIRRGAALALLSAMLFYVGAVVQRADRQIEQWGTTRPVVVAQRELPGGSDIGAGAFAITDMPIALTPSDALDELPASADRVITTLRSGDVLTERDLASFRSASIDVPLGKSVIAIPSAVGLPPLQVGDSIDLFLIDDALDADERSPGAASHEAEVLLVDQDSISVAVSTSEVRRVAQTLSSGRVVIALRRG